MRGPGINWRNGTGFPYRSAVACPNPFPFGHIGIELTSNLAESGGTPREETPFRMLILGDWSGRGNRRLDQPRFANRRPVRVDRDNLEEVLKKGGAELRLPAGEGEGP